MPEELLFRFFEPGLFILPPTKREISQRICGIRAELGLPKRSTKRLQDLVQEAQDSVRSMRSLEAYVLRCHEERGSFSGLAQPIGRKVVTEVSNEPWVNEAVCSLQGHLRQLIEKAEKFTSSFLPDQSRRCAFNNLRETKAALRQSLTRSQLTTTGAKTQSLARKLRPNLTVLREEGEKLAVVVTEKEELAQDKIPDRPDFRE